MNIKEGDIFSMKDNKEYCPHCQSNLQGEQIPLDKQADYNATHFSNKIGIYDRALDRTIKWKCPYCQGEWNK